MKIKNIKNKARAYLTAGAVVALSLVALPNESLAKDRSGRIAVYSDTRGSSESNITLEGVSKNTFGSGVKGFGFIDKFNQGNIYLEARLSKEIAKGIGPAIEYNGNLDNQNVWRAGFVFEPGFGKIIPNTNLGVKWFPVSTNDKGSQIAIYGGRKIFKNTSVGGFFDYNLKSKKVVSEIQLSQSLTDHLNAVVEARYNGFFPKRDRFGVGVGLEYKF